MVIVHELSWSASRQRTFETCRRRYFWDYYGSWRGWERNASATRRRAYVLKKMTRMPMWAGDCLHDALASWFDAKRHGRVGTPAEVSARALDRLREGYRQSRDGRWKERPSKLTHLAEHHFDEPEIDEPSGRAAEYGKRFVQRIEDCVRCFFGAEELERVREAAPADYLACEEMGTIELFGTKVFAIPDFAMRERGDGGETTWIYDWKTGRPRPEDTFQLSLYVHYAAQRWGVEPRRVRCVDAYLGEGTCREFAFTDEELERALTRVKQSTEEMRALHFDADASAGDLSAFALLPAEGSEAHVCRTCNYRELCHR